MAASMIAALSPRVADAQITEVIRVGDTAPDFQGQFRSLKRPESAGDGQATFIARTTGGFNGIYTAGTLPDAVLTFRGEVGAAGEVRRFSRPAANVDAEHAWQAHTVGVGTGIFSDAPGIYLGIVAVKGNPAGAGLLDTFERPVITDTGDVVFFAELSTSVDGIFRCSGGNGNCDTGTALLEQIAAAGTVYTDSVDAEARVICSFTEQFDASNYGIAIRARTARQTTGCGGTQLETILRKQYGGGFQAVAKDGDDALPAPSSRKHFRFDGPPEINNDGDVTFLGETTTPVDDVIYFCDVLSCPAAPPTPVVVQRTLDPDGNRVTRFKAVGASDANEVVFQAVVELAGGGKALAIYLSPSPGVLQKIIAKKEVNGGLEFRRLGKPSMSSDGYVAFEALVKDGITSQSAVFVYH
jgi:hypothetical protein